MDVQYIGKFSKCYLKEVNINFGNRTGGIGVYKSPCTVSGLSYEIGIIVIFPDPGIDITRGSKSVWTKRQKYPDTKVKEKDEDGEKKRVTKVFLRK